jgi:hypothetical protein
LIEIWDRYDRYDGDGDTLNDDDDDNDNDNISKGFYYLLYIQYVGGSEKKQDETQSLVCGTATH